VNTGDYPHAYLPVDDFHKSMLKDVMQTIVKSTAKVAIEERVITEVIKKRFILDEELADVTLPMRDPKTLISGNLPTILCG